MNFEIITDSGSNLTDTIINDYAINIMSLTFRINEKEFISYSKDAKTNNKKYYEMMRQGEVIQTSQLNYEVCRQAFESILKEGKDILYIGFSSALSGTFNVSELVAKELQPVYPNRKIYTVDSLSASMGQGLIVFNAAELKKQGKSIEEIKQWIIDNRLRLCHYFTVDDLKYLKRGGRLSASKAMIGSLLNIKPVLHVNNEGKLVPISKAKGRRKSLEALLNEMTLKCIQPEEQLIFIAHGDCLDDANLLETMIREKFKVKNIIINEIDPVIGAHSGPGTIALFFFGNER